jgi:hypothetical protein
MFQGGEDLLQGSCVGFDSRPLHFNQVECKKVIVSSTLISPYLRGGVGLGATFFTVAHLILSLN